ncbi:MAG: tRNA-dependent cyclodipeptide synthase [Candidatus Woesearchaeota archaeon]
MNIKYYLKGQAYETGYQIIEKKGTAIVGMSPGNSYFKKETIEELLTECTKIFSKILIMIPDKPAIHTYNALGYAKTKAERKARLSSNALINIINGVLPTIKEKYDGEIRIATWDDGVAKSEEYHKELNDLLKLYESNINFKEDVRTTTKGVIANKIKDGQDIEKSIDEGIKYLLSEFAFVSACSKINNEEIVYVYHNPWDVYVNYVNGAYDEKKSNLGFAIML